MLTVLFGFLGALVLLALGVLSARADKTRARRLFDAIDRAQDASAVAERLREHQRALRERDRQRPTR